MFEVQRRGFVQQRFCAFTGAKVYRSWLIESRESIMDVKTWEDDWNGSNADASRKPLLKLTKTLGDIEEITPQMNTSPISQHQRKMAKSVSYKIYLESKSAQTLHTIFRRKMAF